MQSRTGTTVLLGLLTTAATAFGQTAFTYQGQLKDGGGAADGSYNLVFTLWNALSGGSQIGAPDNEPGTIVQDGVFTVQLNDLNQFGAAAFDGSPRWVQVSVNGTALAPRQPLTAAPYAMYAFDGPGGGGGFWAANGSSIYKTNSGNVGIGTNTPDAALEVRRTMRVANIQSGSIVLNAPGVMELQSNAVGIDHPYGSLRFLDGAEAIRASIEYGDSPALISPYAMRFATEGQTRMSILNTGLVGIGEPIPLALLHVENDTQPLAASALYQDELVISAADAVAGLYSSGAGTRGSTLVLGEVDGSGGQVDKWALGRNTSGAGSAFYVKYGPSNQYDANTTMMAIEADGTTYFNAGNVGIGTTSPIAKLHISTSGEQVAQFNQFGNQPGVQITSISSSSNYPALSVSGFSNNVEAFRVVGEASIDVLKITGADVAEKFPTSETDRIEPGTVMELDPDNAGKLRIARGEYNRRVAGVVSGAGDIPVGAVLGHLPGHEDAPAIALSGRVWVACDATERGIEIGDLLTTSRTAGRAMKVVDYPRAQGAILGKAMTELKQGEIGLVLVLVNLQ